MKVLMKVMVKRLVMVKMKILMKEMVKVMMV